MKKRISRAICIFVILLFAAAGCSKSEEKLPEKPSFGLNPTAENDIMTYEKLDLEKTTLIVSVTGNIGTGGLCEAFERKYPDVQTVLLDITGGNDKVKPAVAWIEHGFKPDIMFMVNNLFDQETLEKDFVNLSGKQFVANYQTEALNRAAVNANIYWLPGPSQVFCTIYNKTMFDQHGWEKPRTFDEFVELGKRIIEETNGEIKPWNPNAKYSNDFLCAIDAFSYTDVYGGVENRTWYREFLNGNRTFKGHMEPYFERVQQLIDAGLLLPEHFSYSASTRKKEFREGKIAMLNAPLTLELNDLPYEFGYFPYPGRTENDSYVSDFFFCCMGMPKKDENSKAHEAALKMLEFFSTPEGQRAFIGDSIMMSNVKNVTLSDSARLSDVQNAIDNGRLFSQLSYNNGVDKTNFSIADEIRAMAEGRQTAAQAIENIDKQPYLPKDESQTQQPEKIAEAAEDFTILEVSNYFADMYRDKAGADIGLIANNSVYRGNVMRIFAGDITADDVTVLKPRSFDNGSVLVKLAMTGRQLLDALNAPLGESEKPADCVYAFSGLKCTIAPWRPLGERLFSISLYDGTPIEEDKEYTVAAWQGTISDEFITRTLETYEGTFEELLTARLAAQKVIAPSQRDRATLVWDERK